MQFKRDREAPERSYKKGFLYYDDVELTEEYKKIEKKVETEVERRLRDVPRGMGYCHAYWACKREVLNEYGIEWRSPSAMNPGCMFD